MNFTKIKEYIPGIIVSLFIAIISVFLGNKAPIIGANIFALFIGIMANSMFTSQQHLDRGLNFVSKRLLKLAIILLGTGLSINQVLTVGKYSLFVMIFTLTAAFASAYIFGRMLKVNWKLSSLIGAGTGICGGSAIATLSPIIDADDTSIAYSMSATFVFDMLMIVLFPIMGKMLNLTDLAYGLWTGTAVNDTSSVVAAGYAFSDAAGNFATIVKLTRTTSIVPIALIFSAVAGYKQAEAGFATHKGYIDIKQIFPWFILLFVLSAILNTIGFIPPRLHTPLAQISKFMMTMALSAIGLKTNFKKMVKTGIQPMILGFIVSLVVVVVSIAVQFLTGQI